MAPLKLHLSDVLNAHSQLHTALHRVCVFTVQMLREVVEAYPWTSHLSKYATVDSPDVFSSYLNKVKSEVVIWTICSKIYISE